MRKWAFLGGLLILAGITLAIHPIQRITPLANQVRALTKPGEQFYCNRPFSGKILSLLTGRKRTSEIAAATLIIWMKDSPGRPSREFEGIVLEHQLRPLAETGIAYLYLNPHPKGLKH